MHGETVKSLSSLFLEPEASLQSSQNPPVDPVLSQFDGDQTCTCTCPCTLTAFSLNPLWSNGYYVPPDLTFKNSLFCPHGAFVFCMYLRTTGGYFPM